METVGTDRTRREEEGLKICCEIIEQVRGIPGIAGFHLMPIHWEAAVAEIVSRSGLAPASQILASKEPSTVGAGGPSGVNHREPITS